MADLTQRDPDDDPGEQVGVEKAVKWQDGVQDNDDHCSFDRPLLDALGDDLNERPGGEGGSSRGDCSGTNRRR